MGAACSGTNRQQKYKRKKQTHKYQKQQYNEKQKQPSKQTIRSFCWFEHFIANKSELNIYNVNKQNKHENQNKTMLKSLFFPRCEKRFDVTVKKS
jgi:hypothetical protein